MRTLQIAALSIGGVLGLFLLWLVVSVPVARMMGGNGWELIDYFWSLPRFCG